MREDSHNSGIVNQTRVLVLESRQLMGDVLSRALSESGFGVDVVHNYADAPTIARDCAADIALIDVSAQPEDCDIASVVAALHGLAVRVVVLTGDLLEPRLADFLDAGADGLLSVNSRLTDLIDAVVSTMVGGSIVSLEQRYRVQDARRRQEQHRKKSTAAFATLTRREQQVLFLMTAGRSAAEIADENYVAVSTVRSQISSVLSKLGVHSQLAAVALARDSGWVAEPT